MTSITDIDSNTSIDVEMIDERKSRKKQKRWRVVFKISCVIFVIAATILAFIWWSYYSGQKVYDDLQPYTDLKHASLSDMKVDWDGLREKNADIVAWIYVPGTSISYPVVWREGDNNYYLTHNFNGQSSLFGAEYGCIFLSGENRRDFSDNCNFIYGHNMYNGTVFSVFSDRQGDSDWFNSHRNVYILTPDGNYRCQTFAQNKVAGSSNNIAYSSFGTYNELWTYIEERRAANLVTPDPAGRDTDKIERLFCLSTCSSPDSNMRVITFSSQEEFASFVSDGSISSSVSEEDLGKVDEDTTARTN